MKTFKKKSGARKRKRAQQNSLVMLISLVGIVVFLVIMLFSLSSPRPSVRPAQLSSNTDSSKALPENDVPDSSHTKTTKEPLRRDGTERISGKLIAKTIQERDNSKEKPGAEPPESKIKFEEVPSASSEKSDNPPEVKIPSKPDIPAAMPEIPEQREQPPVDNQTQRNKIGLEQPPQEKKGPADGKSMPVDEKEQMRMAYLKKALASPNLDTRRQAVTELGSIKNAEAFAMLTKGSHLISIEVREVCMAVLGAWTGDLREKAAEILMKHLLTDPTRTVRQAAANALGTMGRDDFNNAGQQARAEKISKCLIQSLSKDESKAVHTSAIQGLTTLGDKRNIPAIARYGLSSPYQCVRIETSQAFKSLQAREYVDLLTRHFPHENHLAVSDPMAEVIYELDKEKAFPVLATALLHPETHNSTRRVVGKLLGNYSNMEKFRVKAVRHLATAFFEARDQDLRLVIVKSIFPYGKNTPEVRTVLDAASRDTPAIRKATKELLDFGIVK